MPLYMGGQRIAKLYYGATPIARAYQGAALVFDAAAPPRVLTYRTNASDDVNRTTYTFAAQPVGGAAADRHVIAGVLAATNDIVSVTIGGVSALLLGPAEGTSNLNVALAIANVPTGTTADVVVGLAGESVACAIGVWTATGLASATPHDHGGDNGDPQSVTLDTLAGGFAVAVCGYRVGSPPATSWTGVTQDFITGSIDSARFSGAQAATDGDPLLIEADNTTDTRRAMVAASW
jgi:hypothetical protein